MNIDILNIQPSNASSMLTNAIFVLKRLSHQQVYNEGERRQGNRGWTER